MKRAFLKFLKHCARIAIRSKVGRFPLARGVYHSCLQPFLPNLALVSLEIEDVEMQLWVPKHDAMFSELHIEGEHEKWVTKKLKDVVQRGMTVVDVGASFGYFTILAAKLVGRGKVFAFEPNPFLYNLLQENIELNQLNNVIPVQKAASNRVGTTQLWLASNIGASNTIGRRDRNEYVIVEATSLDEFFKDNHLSSIDVLKMDIEGTEILALSGMNQMMTKSENLKMIIEFHPHRIRASGHSPKQLWVELRQNGFWPPFLIGRDGQIMELVTHFLIQKVEEEKHPVHLFIKKKVSDEAGFEL